MTQGIYQTPGAFITHLIKCGFKRYGPVTTVNDFEIHDLDLTSLNLDVGILVPFVISKRLSGYKIIDSEQLAKILPDLVALTQSLRKFAVLAVGGKLIRIEKQIIEDLGVLSTAIMDRSTIEAVLTTTDPEVRARVLSAALVQYLGREALSPYVVGRPAIGGRFFGRSTLVKRIIPSAGNFTFVGNRRIGKTSLLKEIKQRLALQNVRTAEIYGATCASTSDVVYKLLSGLDKFREAEHILAEPKRANSLPAFLHMMADTERRPVAVFVDEVDRILEFDAKQDYQLMHLLRETFEGHHFCRIFFAGFRKVMEARQSASAPVFNFTTFVEVPFFNHQETFDMVTKPLERLGIAVAGTDLPQVIYDETAGHPELIQVHCNEIIRFFQGQHRVPTGSDLLGAVFNSGEYKQKVLGTFLANTNPHEELLCYLLMREAERTSVHSFAPHDVHRVLADVGIKLGMREVTGVITNLKVSGIISQLPGSKEAYRFCAPKLVDYSIGLPLDLFIDQALQEIEEPARDTVAAGGHKSRTRAAIFAEPPTTESKPKPAADDKRRVAHRAESLIRIKSLSHQVKHICFMPQGGVLVQDAEGLTTLSGSLNTGTVEDLNERCLEIVDHWTTQGMYEQKLRRIGAQLSEALRMDIPDLGRHLIPNSDRDQVVVVTDAHGLQIPFELLPHEKSHLATNIALARSLVNYRLPPDVRSSFHQLIASLGDRTEAFRVLLVSSDLDELETTEDELQSVRSHIEKAFEGLRLPVDFVKIPPTEATAKRVEYALTNEGPFQLVHFVGHGRHFSENDDASGMVLLSKDGQPEVITCKRLRNWFKGAGLWMAYFSCCYSSAVSGSGIGLSQRYVGMIEATVAAGVPNVIGFRWMVSDRSAYYLADEFYRQLFEVQDEKNLSLAMLEARRAVERRPDHFDAWASSMLITQYS